MALPNDKISIPMVARELGTTENDLGRLFLHENVNPFGFNVTGGVEAIALQNSVWGKSSGARAKLSPLHPDYVEVPSVARGYNLGVFRGYRHDWKVYILDGATIEGDNYYEPMTVTVKVNGHPLVEDKPEPTIPVVHKFKVEMSRVPTFTAHTTVTIFENFEVTYPSDTFTIQPDNPPDYTVNGQLNIGDVFYLRITHVESPEMRWSDFLNQIIVSAYAPGDIYTNTLEMTNVVGTAVKKTTTPRLTLFTISADIFADYRDAHNVTVKAELSNDPYMINNLYTLNQTVSIPKNDTNPGTKQFVQNVSFDFSNTEIDKKVSVGDTVYYLLYIDGLIKGDKNVIVTNQLIIE